MLVWWDRLSCWRFLTSSNLAALCSSVSEDSLCSWELLSCNNLAALSSSVSEDSLCSWELLTCSSLAALCSSVSEDRCCCLLRLFFDDLVSLWSSVSQSLRFSRYSFCLSNLAHRFSGVSACLRALSASLHRCNLARHSLLDYSDWEEGGWRRELRRVCWLALQEGRPLPWAPVFGIVRGEWGGHTETRSCSSKRAGQCNDKAKKFRAVQSKAVQGKAAADQAAVTGHNVWPLWTGWSCAQCTLPVGVAHSSYLTLFKGSSFEITISYNLQFLWFTPLWHWPLHS